MPPDHPLFPAQRRALEALNRYGLPAGEVVLSWCANHAYVADEGQTRGRVLALVASEWGEAFTDLRAHRVHVRPATVEEADGEDGGFVECAANHPCRIGRAWRVDPAGRAALDDTREMHDER